MSTEDDLHDRVNEVFTRLEEMQRELNEIRVWALALTMKKETTGGK